MSCRPVREVRRKGAHPPVYGDTPDLEKVCDRNGQHRFAIEQEMKRRATPVHSRFHAGDHGDTGRRAKRTDVVDGADDVMVGDGDRPDTASPRARDEACGRPLPVTRACVEVKVNRSGHVGLGSKPPLARLHSRNPEPEDA